MSKLKKPPTRIEDHDRITIALSAERAMRLQLQHEAAAAHANNIGAQREAHGAKHKAAVEALRTRYALAEADTIDLDTGAIVRAPAPEEPK